MGHDFQLPQQSAPPDQAHIKKPIEDYVECVCNDLHLPDETLDEIRDQLIGRLAAAIEEKKTQGQTDEQAAREALVEAPSTLEQISRYRRTFFRQHIARLSVRLIGLAAFVGLLLWTMLSRGTLGMFIFGKVALLVLGGSTVLLWGTFGKSAINNALNMPFWLAVNDKQDRAGWAKHVLLTWAVYALSCGFLAVTLGAISALVNSYDPEKIGPSIAFAILGMLYGATFAGILWVFAAGLHTTRSLSPRYEVRPWQTVVALGLFMSILVFLCQWYTPNWQEYRWYVEPVYYFFVVVGGLALVMATYGCRASFHTVTRQLPVSSGDQDYPCKLRRLGLYFGITGLIGTLIGGVIMLAQLDDPPKIPAAIACALLPLLYGIILGLACWVLAGPTPHGVSSSPKDKFSCES